MFKLLTHKNIHNIYGYSLRPYLTVGTSLDYRSKSDGILFVCLELLSRHFVLNTKDRNPRRRHSSPIVFTSKSLFLRLLFVET